MAPRTKDPAPSTHKYGTRFAQYVAAALRAEAGQRDGSGSIARSHRDYCGWGVFFCPEKPGTEPVFLYTTSNDGWPGEVEEGDPSKKFGTEGAFVSWLADQSDASLFVDNQPLSGGMMAPYVHKRASADKANTTLAPSAPAEAEKLVSRVGGTVTITNPWAFTDGHAQGLAVDGSVRGLVVNGAAQLTFTGLCALVTRCGATLEVLSGPFPNLTSQQLTTLVKMCPSLKTLSVEEHPEALSREYLTAGVSAVFQSLAPTLEVLSLVVMNDALGGSEPGPAACCMPARRGGAGADHALWGLRRFTALRELELVTERTANSEANSEALAGAVRCMPRLQSLRLGYGFTARPVAEAVAVTCPDMRTLELAEDLDDGLLGGLAAGCPGLVSLTSIWCDGVTDSGVETLLKACPRMEHLELRSDGLTEWSLAVLATLGKNLKRVVWGYTHNLEAIPAAAVEAYRKAHPQVSLYHPLLD